MHLCIDRRSLQFRTDLRSPKMIDPSTAPTTSSNGDADLEMEEAVEFRYLNVMNLITASSSRREVLKSMLNTISVLRKDFQKATTRNWQQPYTNDGDQCRRWITTGRLVRISNVYINTASVLHSPSVYPTTNKMRVT